MNIIRLKQGGNRYFKEQILRLRKNILEGTDVELGRRLTKMGYEHKRLNKGLVFRVEEI